MKLTRRALLAAAGGASLAAYQGHPVGLALYTVREPLLKRTDEVLKLAADIGYKEVEILRNQIDTVGPRLASFGLRPISLHFETPIITGNWQAWKDADMPPVSDKLTFEDAMDAAAKLEIRNVVFNYLPPKERGDLDYYRGLSDKLNAAASKCNARGLQLWYHNHNFEFAQKSEGRPIDVLLSRLDRKLILFEVDAFWVSMAGLDPAEYIRGNSGRVAAIHLKDRARNTEVPRFDIASVPHSAYKEVGEGELNFAAIIAAGKAAGASHFFVEQDHSSDPLASIRRSYRAVRSLGL